MTPRSMRLDPVRSGIARGVGGAAARETKTQYRSADGLAGMRQRAAKILNYHSGQLAPLFGGIGHARRRWG